jgi:hypothetical protein
MAPNEPPPAQIVPGRDCGDCSLCCKIFAVEELEKPSWKWCQHCAPGRGGCLAYDDRPKSCRTFMCVWLVDSRFGPEWKPSRSKMIITADQTGHHVTIRCDPGSPNAWRRPPFYRQILELARAARAKNSMVTINIEERVTVVDPNEDILSGRR